MPQSVEKCQCRIHTHENAARLDCPFGNRTTAQGGCLVCKTTEYKCVCIVDNREGKQVQRLSYMSVGIEGDEEPRGQRRAESPRSCHRPVNVTMRCSLRGEWGGLPLLYLGNPRVLASNLLALDQVLRPDPS